MRKIFTVLYVLILGIPMVIGIGIGKLFRLKPAYYLSLCRPLASGLRKLMGVKFIVTGLDNIPKDDGFLIVSNHESNYDVIAASEAFPMPIGFIGKKELGKIFFFPWTVEGLGGFLIDREDIRSQVKVISEAAKKVQDGNVVLIFPQGRRTAIEEDFKPGSLKIAFKAKKTIVPIRITGSRLAFEDFRFSNPPTVTLDILEPIAYEEYKDRSTVELAKELQDKIYEGK